MPPARAETLLEMKQNEKNRFYYTKEEQYELLNKQKPIDVNDPRNEEIIKAIQRMKNDYMDRLLDNDAKF
jgi:endonuclease I